jgi:hypothetical protein
MKGQDIVILLKLACLNEQETTLMSGRGDKQLVPPEAYSVRGLAASLGISKSEVAASLNRSLASSLANQDQSPRRVKPNRRDLFNFLIYGLKFVFPAELGPLERGLATGFSAPVLSGLIVNAGQDTLVWPDAHGDERGTSVTPLFDSVPEAVRSDPALYRYLALIDVIRLGRQRETNLATEQLKERLLQK